MQQSCPEVSVAVYDDNSTDNTRELEVKYPNVHWEFGEQNRGYVYARNKFMSESTTTYFCSLDDDSWFIKYDSLAKSIDYLDNNLDVAAIAFDILSPDRSNEVKEGRPVEVNSFIGCGHVVRLSQVRQVGFYDPPPSYYGGEEKDLCIRLIDKGHKVMLLPGVHVWHDKTNVARNITAQHRSGICNDMVFTWRRTPLLLLFPVLIAKFANHLRFAVRYKEEKLIRPCIQGFTDFLRALLKGKLNRHPVSMKAFKKFLTLVKI